jgi:hypothetical protein
MGALILGRKDDGTLEVIRADDEIELDDELLDDLPTEGDYRLEGKLLKVEGSNGSVTYTLVEHHRDTHVWRAVKTEEGGR